MYSAPLSKPRAKSDSRRRRRRGHGGEREEEEQQEGPDPLVLQQPFPVPIASLTHIPANNSIWRWYKGTLAGNHVVLMAAGDDEGGDGDARKLWQMGYFGEITAGVGGDAEEGRKYCQIALEEIDPGREEAEKVSAESTTSKQSDSDTSSSSTSNVTLRLDLCEAFFLSYALGCLLVHKEVEEKDKEGSSSKSPPSLLSIDQMWSEFCSAEASFPSRYAVYHHFRCKGWVVRSGQRQFGCHFLLYKHGPPFFHASYSVRVEGIEESLSSSLSWRDLAGLNRVTEAAAKELLLARVKRIDDDAAASALPSSPTEALGRLLVEEVLVRRWVPSQEREDG